MFVDKVIFFFNELKNKISIVDQFDSRIVYYTLSNAFITSNFIFTVTVF